MKKGIGAGIEDFREVIREDCYYFDKIKINYLPIQEDLERH